MIVKRKDESALSAIAEDADDLLALRRVIKRGDMITGSTTRVLKRDRDYSRPDRGERVRITVTIMAEKISLDGTIERLRIGGTVHESNNDSVPHGTHHSMTVAAGDAITISKRVQREGGGKGGWGQDGTQDTQGRRRREGRQLDIHPGRNGHRRLRGGAPKGHAP